MHILTGTKQQVLLKVLLKILHISQFIIHITYYLREISYSDCHIYTFRTMKDEDQILVNLLRKGDRRAFEQLFKKYWPLLFDAAYYRVQSREMAEELVQELFADIWCRRKEINITDSIRSYLFTALKYRILNHFRSNTVKHTHQQRITENRPVATNAVEEHVLFNDLYYALEHQIKYLPQKCQLVFNLSRKDHLSYQEIARQLDISVNTVEKHMGKALKTLRANLKDYVVTLLIASYLF